MWCINRYYKFCLYSYSDEPSIIYLSEVEVFKKYRKKGYGNILLKHAKILAKERRYKIMYLKVIKNSWQENWYKRNGFEFFENDKFTNNVYCWLKYNINKNQIKYEN